jgi:hypothetical protein
MGDNFVYCQQRKLHMLFHVPDSRFNLVSPYTNANLTKFDLDMRRKAEVLKHTGPQKSNQVNKLTKAQLFAQVIRGYSPTQKLMSKHYSQSQMDFCDSSMNLVLTSSSDVPGPIRSLYLDQNIPLYNYATPNKTFSENVFEDDLGFRFFVNTSSTLFAPGVSQNIGALEILDKIPNEITTFKITIRYDKPYDKDPTLIVTYGGSPMLMQSKMDYNKQTPNLLIISNIAIYTTAGYFLEFALQFNDSSYITIYPDDISIE